MSKNHWSQRMGLLIIVLTSVTLGLILVSCQKAPEDQATTIELTRLRPELKEQKVLFVEGDTIFVTRVDGTNLITITPHIVGDRPSISPDGMQIAYTCPSEQLQQYLEALKAAYGKTPLVSLTIQSDDIPAIDICLTNMDGVARRLVTASQIPGAVALDDPVFSPDGYKILFTAGFSISLKIFEIGIDGSGLRQLTDGWNASYSPDGQQIVFLCDGTQICVMNADGGAKKRLTNNANMMHFGPQYTPDGHYIIFWGRKANLIEDLLGRGFKLYALDINNLTIHCLTPYEKRASVVAISTDGKEIMYQSDKGTYVVNIDSSEKRKLREDWWDVLPAKHTNGEEYSSVK